MIPPSSTIRERGLARLRSRRLCHQSLMVICFSPEITLPASLERETGSYQYVRSVSDGSFTNFFRRTSGCRLELCRILHSSRKSARRAFPHLPAASFARVQEKHVH